MAIKSDIRKQFLAARKALSADEVERRSLAIADLLYRGFVIRVANKLNSRHFHTFLPIARQNEVKTWPIIHQIWREFPQISIAVSVTNFDNQPLTHYELTPETVLIENRWGIPEPNPTASLQPLTRQFDVVLVPLLAFDLQGHRVGYGGGYYDRFLAECGPNCLKIGLSLFEPVDKIDDVEETDVSLDKCVTPKALYSF